MRDLLTIALVLSVAALLRRDWKIAADRRARGLCDECGLAPPEPGHHACRACAEPIE